MGRGRRGRSDENLFLFLLEPSRRLSRLMSLVMSLVRRSSPGRFDTDSSDSESTDLWSDTWRFF